MLLIVNMKLFLLSFSVWRSPSDIEPGLDGGRADGELGVLSLNPCRNPFCPSAGKSELSNKNYKIKLSKIRTPLYSPYDLFSNHHPNDCILAFLVDRALVDC